MDAFLFYIVLQFMDTEKLNFIRQAFVPKLKSLSSETIGNWGKMNAQQMVEHVTAFFNVSIEKLRFPLVTPAEQLPKFKEFLLSDKQFRENTKAPASVIGEEALPLRYENMEQAVEKLSAAIANFEQYFHEYPNKKTLHPVFGELNFEEWTLLHYKHITHHLRQFGLL